MARARFTVTHCISASTTINPMATTAPESPQLKVFVRSAMEKHGLTEQEVRTRAIEMYGSLERTMQAMQIAEARGKAAIEKAFPNGYAGMLIGRKPEPGEEVKFLRLRDDLTVRVWGGNLAIHKCYCFDFINREHQYILTPDDVKIYSMPTPFVPSFQVLSLEDSVEKAGATSLYSHATRSDPNWETYLIPEGTVLRITQQNGPDHFLHIPTRTPPDFSLVPHPW
ncbi:hypothetical protein F5887DRAFT_1086031 [Amanita rubescens]|nr:hypothetical protein F5887DRAFT_1086031 [Amanita rubescens]